MGAHLASSCTLCRARGCPLLPLLLGSSQPPAASPPRPPMLRLPSRQEKPAVLSVMLLLFGSFKARLFAQNLLLCFRPPFLPPPPLLSLANTCLALLFSGPAAGAGISLVFPRALTYSSPPILNHLRLQLFKFNSTCSAGSRARVGTQVCAARMKLHGALPLLWAVTC